MYLWTCFFKFQTAKHRISWRNHLGPAAWTSPKPHFLRLNHVPWSSYQGDSWDWVMGHVPMGILKHNGHMDHGHGNMLTMCRLDPKCIKMCQAELVLFPNSLSTSPFVIGVQLHLMMRQSQWLAIPWLPLWGRLGIKIHDSQLRLIGHLRIDRVQGFWLIAISVPFALKCGLIPRFLIKPL